MVVGQKIKVIEFPIEDTFVHEYRLRQSGTKDLATEVTIPRDFIRKLFRESKLPYNEFLQKCKVAVYYGGGSELLLKFEIPQDSSGEGQNLEQGSDTTR
jgi:hypothetical protein